MMPNPKWDGSLVCAHECATCKRRDSAHLEHPFFAKVGNIEGFFTCCDAKKLQEFFFFLGKNVHHFYKES